jgi:S-adenosylmethionine synthetase
VTQWTFTSESVTEGHPDKMADQISDAVLDAILAEDPTARVACETLSPPAWCVVAGEITTSAYVDIPKIARETINGIGYDNGNTASTATRVASSPRSTSRAPTSRRASTPPSRPAPVQGRRGPQQPGRRRPGHDVRLRLRRDPDLMPLPIWLAHRWPSASPRCARPASVPYLRPDGKTQVTFDYDGTPVRLRTVLDLDPAPARHRPRHHPPDLIEHVIRPSLPEQFADDDYDVTSTPPASSSIGGPHADTGLTGRKIIVDTYGGMARHGGGAFSGKDPSKVDRSAAYAGRWVAKHVVAAGAADPAARCRSPTPSAWPTP